MQSFDVVVIGRSLGCLTTAALLARRDFRVLVLGHGDLPASYSAEAMEIGFNARYLLDVAQQIEGEEALFELADSGSPTLVRDEADEAAPIVTASGTGVQHSFWPGSGTGWNTGASARTV